MPGWTGTRCDVPVTPPFCSLTMCNSTGTQYFYQTQCVCFPGWSGALCDVPQTAFFCPLDSSPPPPAPPPIANWTSIDNGEVIAIDIEYAAYALREQFYNQAFADGITEVLGEKVYDIFVSIFVPSSANTTLVYFDTVLAGTDYDVPLHVQAVKALFDTNNSGCASTAPVGCPAYARLTAACVAHGLPATALYYQDQFPPTAVHTPGNNVPVNSSKVGTWKVVDNNEVMAIGIPFDQFAVRFQFYRGVSTRRLPARAPNSSISSHARSA